METIQSNGLIAEWISLSIINKSPKIIWLVGDFRDVEVYENMYACEHVCI